MNDVLNSFEALSDVMLDILGAVHEERTQRFLGPDEPQVAIRCPQIAIKLIAQVRKGIDRHDAWKKGRSDMRCTMLRDLAQRSELEWTINCGMFFLTRNSA